MGKPRLLDLFCGAGGAAMGYHRSGFEVVGVDIKPQPRYPFEFHQGDALEFCGKRGREFEAIHASPPCQGYSIMRNLPWLRGKEYPMLIEPTLELLEKTNCRWVLENVMGAKLKAGWLCGRMFGLPFFRHRFFQANFLWLAPPHPEHNGTIRKGRMLGDRARTVAIRNGAQRVGANVGHAAGVGMAREVMGVQWMNREETTQAIPPAYTEFIGKQLRHAI